MGYLLEHSKHAQHSHDLQHAAHAGHLLEPRTARDARLRDQFNNTNCGGQN